MSQLKFYFLLCKIFVNSTKVMEYCRGAWVPTFFYLLKNIFIIDEIGIKNLPKATHT